MPPQQASKMSILKDWIDSIDWSSWDTRANCFVLGYMLYSILLLCIVGKSFQLWFGIIVFFSALFGFLFRGLHQVSPKLHSAYSDMTELKKKNWNLKLMSTVHAVFVGIGGLFCLITDRNLTASLFTTTSEAGLFFVSVFAGYCAADSYLTLKYWDGTGGIAIVIHHALVILMATYPLVTGEFVMITCCYLVNELSTPFMNNIYFFKDCGVPKDSKMVLYNSVIFTILFFFCRVCMNTYVVYRTFFGEPEFWGFGIFYKASGTFFICGFCLLQYYWFALIIKNAIKILRGAPDTSQYSRVQQESDENLEEMFSIDEEIV